MASIETAPSSPPSPVLRKYHPSRSISPIPRPPSFPRRADKALYITRNRLVNRSLSSDAINKKEKHEPAASSPAKALTRKCHSFETVSSEDIIADLSAAEQTRWRWTSVVFHRSSSSCDEDDASTSTATSSSSLSEETFSSSTPVLSGQGVFQGNRTSPVLVSSPNDDTTTTCPTTWSGDSLPDEPANAEVTRHSVTFDIDATRFHHLEERRDALTRDEKEARWYSRAEIAQQRKAMKRAIHAVRSDARGIDLLLDDSHLHPMQCVTGCERYFNMENRFMAQRMMVEAVLENRDQPAELLREIARNISRPMKEMALWHAQLNAIQCWGLSGLKKGDAWTNKELKTSNGTTTKRVMPWKETPQSMGPMILSTPLAPLAKKLEASLVVSPGQACRLSANLSLPSLSESCETWNAHMEEGNSLYLAPRIRPFPNEPE